ncbi:c-type cytochrome biogenesis protein CcmI [Stutzerimonas xanthomarina]|uniref:Cytochrome c-type biogenesis protein CcmH n=2 Tax=Stutzerimonas xanthomarina TaxID=271420 RepID=A0A1M5RHN1_9GAMM|nr:c-type cytochrome biogenesis protein CcmI [Stutzerimonas xanthomarina]MCP9339577.1 c-type cytochrome biogenesis protein CcmI [Stutzerimonas xanthomarina]SEH96651.1 cytochrome c-type biogenesis protein CcmH [Stutzerimonas xanthomarina]SHH25539.1 cytochrome c-type biogenesis protein CcmH [Stutzerimonas xanthomarina DSM 18231]
MIDFWIGAGLLLLAALAFLLLPLLRGRGVQAEEDRTALNVALYQERLGELATQQAAGTLEPEQFEAGRADAARELLDDTEGSTSRRSNHLGLAVPLIAAILMPLLGYGLYLHWGASDKLQLAREFTEQPATMEEMVGRLERAVKAQPESAEAWYFLAKTYMSRERPADAAAAYQQVVKLAGRQPELLGQLAQALYFAGDRKWSEQLQQLTDEALRGDPDEVTSLGLLGIAAYEEERFADAIAFWERLVSTLAAEDPSREAIQGGIARAREQLGEPASASVAEPAGEMIAETGAGLTVEVQLAAEMVDKVRPSDAVFVFARALSGPPMPLAVKRLTVADLPATVNLSDADAMTPQLRLSNFDQVRLFARISKDGDATRGEWQGSSEPLATRDSDGITLTIDQPVTP